jgi:putative DNA primase/helicase
MNLQQVELFDADPLTTSRLDLSDFGNAHRLQRISDNKLRWVEDLEAWAFYDGKRWSTECGEIEARKMAHLVIPHIRKEMRALGALLKDHEALAEEFPAATIEKSIEKVEKRVADLGQHAVRSGNARMTNGMLMQARSLLPAMFADFDKDPLVFNCLNATLRFVRGGDGKWSVSARPHDPADMLMKIANVEYEPKAKCPFWRERLAMLTPDPEQLEAFQLLYGYTLTALTSDQAFYVHQGRGGDGKSATHLALADLHGDYFRHAGVKTFLQGADRGGAEHRSDLVRLAGDVRFVTCDEPKARSVWDGETMKQVTGSQITARGSGAKTEITYRPRFKLFIECNNIPRAPSDDKGFRRRFKLYQWRVSLPEPGQDGYEPIDAVLDRLAAEKSGILNWLIEGCLKWLATRVIPQPKAMDDVLKDYWADSSPMLEWMAEWCDTSDRSARTAFKDLHDAYKKWCEDNGVEHPMSATAFGRALRDRQHPMIKDSRGIRWRIGIKLRDEGFFGDSPVPAAAPVASPARSATSADGPNSGPDDEELIRP